MPILLPLLLAATPAPAYSDADIADAQCVAAFALVASTLKDQSAADPKATAGVVSGMTYFIGKLRGRTPTFDLEAILRSVFRTVKQDTKAQVARCAAEMAAVGELMGKVGKSLSADGI